jgi:hypothetical protein
LVAIALAAAAALATVGCGSNPSRPGTTRDGPAGDGLEGGAPDAPAAPDAADDGGDLDGPSPDADTGDARGDGGMPPPHAITRLDWTAQRGAPLPTTDVVVAERNVFAAHASGFVTYRGCDPMSGCDYDWYDASGTLVRSRDDLMGIYATTVSPDASHMLVVARQAIEDCGPGPSRPTVVTGALQLIELASGVASFEQMIRSNIWSVTAFSDRSTWFRTDPIPDGVCGADPGVWRSLASPHAISPLVAADPSLVVMAEVAPTRWLVHRNGVVGVANPAVTGSFVGWNDAIDDVRATAGWAHAYDGFGDTTERIQSVAPDGTQIMRPAPDDRIWRGREAWGRWVVLCQDSDITRGIRPCRVLDVTGALADRELEIRIDARPGVAFLGRGAAVAAINLAPDGARQLERVDLETGARQVVATGAGTLHPLGDGDAVIFKSDAGALLVEADRETELVAGPLDQVLTSPEPPGGALPVRQRDVAVIVQSPGVTEHTLHVFDLATRRLATLSRTTYFAPHRPEPLLADDCGQPWAMRSAGSLAEQYLQSARWLWFLEYPPASGERYPLWVLPLDLSAPPRRLGGIDPNPVYCHAPLASPDGGLIVLDVDRFDGVSTLTIARP